ncbi:MAG TPA: DUF1800 family protein, partial [Vicinamibacterales bacterium]|nr:DUF1800 family protein [Vicinamibacterales bacterium]
MRVLKRLTCIAVPVLLAAAIGAAVPAALSAQKSAVPANPDDRTIVHVLNRLGFGAGPGDVERVRQIGLRAYIDRQLHPERVADEQMAARLSRFETLDLSTRELAETIFVPAQMARREQQRARAQDPSMAPPDARTAPPAPAQMAIRGERQVLAELTQQKILRAVYSERQLEEVLVDFWFNHFNVFAGKGQTRQYLTEYERDVIRVHALGRFRDLLQATAESPAMLFYLDNWQSAAPVDAQTAGRRFGLFGRGNPRPGMRGRPGRVPPVAPGQPPAAQNRRTRGLNENYARELMEL